MRRARAILIWAALAIAIAVPVAAAAASPLLAWREAIYIAAGFAGIIAMACCSFSPCWQAGTCPAFTASAGGASTVRSEFF